jgi:hypothetical protein
MSAVSMMPKTSTKVPAKAIKPLKNLASKYECRLHDAQNINESTSKSHKTPKQSCKQV